MQEIGLDTGIGAESRIILPSWKKCFVNKAFQVEATGRESEI